MKHQTWKKDEKTELWYCKKVSDCLLGTGRIRQPGQASKVLNPLHLQAIIWGKETLNAHVCYYIECWFCFAKCVLGEPVAVDSVPLMQSRARLARITFQLVSRFSLCNCGANHDGDCLGTCRAFMVTTLNCCRGELALSCSRCVGWHKRNLSSLAAASWHQETGALRHWGGVWDGKRMREIFRGEGARLSQRCGFRWRRIHKGWHRRETEGGRDDTKPLYKHYCMSMI